MKAMHVGQHNDATGLISLIKSLGSTEHCTDIVILFLGSELVSLHLPLAGNGC